MISGYENFEDHFLLTPERMAEIIIACPDATKEEIDGLVEYSQTIAFPEIFEEMKRQLFVAIIEQSLEVKNSCVEGLFNLTDPMDFKVAYMKYVMLPIVIKEIKDFELSSQEII